MTTIEKNVLIARFLGYERVHLSSGDTEYECVDMWEGESTPERKDHWIAKELQFHSNWNWVMVVVDKIENLEEGSYQVDIRQEGCCITKYCKHLIADNRVTTGFVGVKLESLYECIVDFIIWYNKNVKV